MTLELNYEFSLEVPEGYERKIIGSEMEPKMISSAVEDIERWDNGPTIYERYTLVEYWLIQQKCKPFLIKISTQSGDYSTLQDNNWEAFSCDHLPSGKGIDRI